MDSDFSYANSDGDGGLITAVMPGWAMETFGRPGSFLLRFDDACWMEAETLPAFIEWLTNVSQSLSKDSSSAPS